MALLDGSGPSVHLKRIRVKMPDTRNLSAGYPWGKIRIMDSNRALAPDVAPQLTPLNVIRFFAARLFSLPGMNFLGQAWFSIFVWQNCLMIVSTYLIEKPWAKRLRREH